MAVPTFIEFTGQARLGRRTKHLTKRLTAGDIAIIDHVDIDRVSAEELLESGVRVVVNVAASASGRYPNPGPLRLVRGVARGPGHKHDLRSVRPYMRDFKPVLIAVDGGADALLEVGGRPDVIVGDMDSVSDKALQCGAELVVHAYANGSAPGAERLDRL